MTIDDKIRDGKLQYDINREAAKISALSSGEIHKYEYLTGENILPSTQQQIIEQAKFALGKPFEKQIRTINDQGQKQVDALKVLKPKSIESESNNKQSINMDIFNKILEERIDEILNMSKEIDYDNLAYNFKGTTPPVNFTIFEDLVYIYNQLKKAEKALPQVEQEQRVFEKDLNKINSKNPKHKSEKQLYSIKNIKNLYDSR